MMAASVMGAAPRRKGDADMSDLVLLVRETCALAVSADYRGVVVSVGLKAVAERGVTNRILFSQTSSWLQLLLGGA